MRTTRRRLVQLSALAVALPVRLAKAVAGDQPPVKTLRILILGGTGFTGPHQVAYALGRGHTVTVFNRGKEANPWPSQVEALVGDRNTGDLKALEGRQWDVCIDNPPTLPFWVRDAGRVLSGKVGQYIFISTISVYASHDTSADETAATIAYAGKDAMAETMETLAAGRGLYGPLKAVSEQEAERQFPGQTTVIRPGLIVGPGDDTDRFTYWPVRLARGGWVLAPGETDPVQFIDARDLAEWTVRMAEQRTLGVFNATGPAHTETMRDLLSGISAPIRSDAHVTWVSTQFLRAQNVSPWSDLPVWIPNQGATAGFARRDIGKALGAGLTFRPLPITAVDTLAWFRTLPADRQAKLKAGLTPEREAELLAKWHAAPDARG